LECLIADNIFDYQLHSKLVVWFGRKQKMKKKRQIKLIFVCM
jgi:hypothetical protein